MKIAEYLDNFAIRFPKCRVVMFADISTGLVLAANNRDGVTQEVLDDILLTATKSADNSELALVAQCLGHKEHMQLGTVVSCQENGFLCLIRVTSSDEALCLMLDPESAVSTTLVEAVAAYESIMEYS